MVWLADDNALYERQKILDQKQREAKPKDWYCYNCSEIVLIDIRCKICGKTETELS